MNVRWILLSSALLVVAANAGPVEEWYRYHNEQGVTVLSQSVPPALADNGYEVVDGDGRLLRKVPSKAERKRLREAEEEQQKRADEDNRRQRADEDLLKLYASSADVAAARDRKLRSIEVDIGRIRADLEALKQKKTNLEQQGAERERGGLGHSEEIFENLEIVEAQIEVQEGNIDSRRREQQQIRESFDRDMERVRLLLGEPPPEAQAETGKAAKVQQAEAGEKLEAQAEAGAANTPAAIAGH